jgi:hypothetical protein
MFIVFALVIWRGEKNPISASHDFWLNDSVSRSFTLNPNGFPDETKANIPWLDVDLGELKRLTVQRD